MMLANRHVCCTSPAGLSAILGGRKTIERALEIGSRPKFVECSFSGQMGRVLKVAHWIVPRSISTSGGGNQVVQD